MATTIPPLFRCPISLELMRNPVTLCTGITYERASIEKWIAEGNLTCPATMQSIQSTELVPNITLQRLIQSFARTHQQQQQQQQQQSVVVQLLNPLQPVQRLIKLCSGSSITNTASVVQELRIVRKSLKENSSMRPELQEELLNSVMVVLELGSLEACEEAIIIISYLLPTIPSDHGLLIQSLCKILSSSRSIECRIRSAVILERLAEDLELTTQLGSNLLLIKGLCAMLRDQKSAKSALSAIRSLLSIRRNRSQLVSAGAVHRIIELLPDLGSRACTELGLCVLERLCRSAEGRASFASHELGMFAVTKKMFRVSAAATELAVAIVWSLCKHSADDNVRRKAVDASAFERLLLLLHVDCSPATKHQVCELLKLLRQVYSEEPCIIASPDQALPGFVPIYPRC